MILSYLAISSITIKDNIIEISIQKDSIVDVFIGINALSASKIEKLCLFTNQYIDRLTFSQNLCMHIKTNKYNLSFCLEEHQFDSLYSLILDFINGLAFPEQHIDIELIEYNTKSSYDCCIKVL